MFYKENGVAHYKCEHCGAVDDLRRVTVERWEAPIYIDGGDLDNPVDGGVEEGEPEYVDTQEAWVECRKCGSDVPPCSNTGDVRDELIMTREREDD